jgi:glycosyltransferase involved in cell wall biosynthesis
MKKLLVIASWFDPNSNVGAFFRNQSEILSENFEVTMCFPAKESKSYPSQKFKLFSYKQVNTKLSSSFTDMVLAKYQLRNAANEIYKHGPFDVCIAQNLISAGFIAHELKKVYNIPYLTIHHNAYMPDLGYFQDNWRIGKILKNSISNYVVSLDLLRQLKIAGRNEKISVIHNPVYVSSEYLLNRYIINKNITIAISGQFNTVVKNHQLFFEALNLLDSEILKGIEVRWLGYNSWGGNLNEEDVKKSVNKYINLINLNLKLYSSLSKDEMYKNLADSNLYVHTSFTETFGITSLEAMKLGVPVLSTQNGGINEYMKHGVNGVLVNSFEPDVFSTALQSTLENLMKFNRRVIHESVRYVGTKEEFLGTLTKAIG